MDLTSLLVSSPSLMSHPNCNYCKTGQVSVMNSFESTAVTVFGIPYYSVAELEEIRQCHSESLRLLTRISASLYSNTRTEYAHETKQ
jgi:hypothetical protein